MDYHQLYRVMPDGTVKQTNPFTGTEVWAVPTRGRKVISDQEIDASPEHITPHSPEDYCSFCESRYLETAPEKSRLVARDGSYAVRHQIPRAEYFDETALFRRVSNLFEIVSIEYWEKNYSYRLSRKNQEWMHAYLADPESTRHVVELLDFKLRRTGKSDEDIARILQKELHTHAAAFFGGCHELVISQRHYRPDAHRASDLFATGDMTDEEHYQYYLFIIDSMTDILANNRYVRYLSVYKNWLRPAGATFDHLHTQIVAIDEWGEAIDRQIEMIKVDKNLFNTYGANFAGQHNLIFAENDHALAFVGIGHRYPTIEIYSKSINARPAEHSPEEVRGVSEIVRACHAAIGSRISVNEEWYYAPIDSIYKMPWHINIKLRVNVPAGFEGGTGIFINPVTPVEMRDILVPRLYRVREERRCPQNIRIAEECLIVSNPLKYYKTS